MPGPQLHPWGLGAGAGWVAAWLLTRRLARRQPHLPPELPDALLPAGLGALLLGWGGGALDALRDAGGPLRPSAALGMLGGMLAAAAWARRAGIARAEALDALAPGALLGSALLVLGSGLQAPAPPWTAPAPALGMAAALLALASIAAARLHCLPRARRRPGSVARLAASGWAATRLLWDLGGQAPLSAFERAATALAWLAALALTARGILSEETR